RNPSLRVPPSVTMPGTPPMRPGHASTPPSPAAEPASLASATHALQSSPVAAYLPEGGGERHDALESARHRRRLHQALLEALDLRRRDILALSDEALRNEATDVLASLIEHDADLPPDIDRVAMLRQVVDEAVGLGP